MMLPKISLRSPLLVAAVVGAALVAGCGGNDDDNTTSTAASAPARTAPPATTPATTPTATTPTERARAPAAAGGASAAVIARGREAFDADGCATCHSISGARGTGPALDGLAGSQVRLDNGRTVTADDAYLTRSIDDPDAEIVDGFTRGIMSSVIRPGSVDPEDTAALVAYIQSLR